MLDLRPVPASSEDMQFGAVNQLEKPEGVGQWNHLVVATVHDQCRCGDSGDVGDVVGDGVEGLLPGRREHLGECLLNAWADARLERSSSYSQQLPQQWPPHELPLGLIWPAQRG